ncbi:hypothetical protein K8R32_04705 [bacterium]|nr:hypothetical protein [bacterium]
MRRKIVGLVFCIFLLLPITVSGAWNIQTPEQDEILHVYLCKKGVEISLEVPLRLGDLKQNMELMKRCAELVAGFKRAGWSRERGELNLGVVELEYEYGNKEITAFAIVRIGKNNCPGDGFNSFKCRNNKVYTNTVPRKVESCIEEAFLSK